MRLLWVLLFIPSLSFPQSSWEVWKEQSLIIKIQGDTLIPLPTNGYILKAQQGDVLLIGPSEKKIFKKIIPKKSFINTQNEMGLWGTYDFYGNNIIPSAYHAIGTYNNGLLPVCYNQKWGFVDHEGNTIIPIRYDSVHTFQNGIVKVYSNSNPIWLDNKGNKISPDARSSKDIKTFSLKKVPHQKGDQLLFYSEGFVAIQRDNRYGYIDTLGKLRIANRYDSILPFYQGKAQFMLNGKWGVMDKGENIVLQPKYDEIGNPVGGLIPVRLGTLWGLVNTKDEQVISFSFEKITPYQHQGWITFKNEKYGAINLLGSQFVNPQFENALPLNASHFGFYEAGKWGVMDYQLNEIIPPINKKIYINPFNENFIVKK